MAELVSCPHCGRVNRLPDIKTDEKGLFRCGACSVTVQRTAARSASLSSDKILDAEYTRYEISFPLMIASWFAAGVLLLGFSALLDPLYGALRFIPFAVMTYATFIAAQAKRKPWIWLMAGLTLLYSPAVYPYFDRVSWIMVDVAAILLLLAAPFNCLVEERAQAHRKRIKADVSEMSTAK